MAYPMLGSIVHFVIDDEPFDDDDTPPCCAAIIIAPCYDEDIHLDLLLFAPPGVAPHTEQVNRVPYDATMRTIGSWHWPSRTRRKENQVFPTIGRIVHYVHTYPEVVQHIPAIITAVGRAEVEVVDLTAFPSPADDHHTLKLTQIDYDGETMEPGTWHWPEMVPGG